MGSDAPHLLARPILRNRLHFPWEIVIYRIAVGATVGGAVVSWNVFPIFLLVTGGASFSASCCRVC
jgi:hypothetical protein